MFKPFKWALAAIAASLVAGGANAATYRLPQEGRPAITVNAADTWSPSRPGSALNLLNPARTGVVSISIEEAPAGFSLDTFRDNYVKAAQCTLLDRTETVRLAGRTASAFYCQPTQGPLAPARVVLLRIDPTHVLSVGHSYRLDAPAAVVQELESVIATITLEP